MTLPFNFINAANSSTAQRFWGKIEKRPECVEAVGNSMLKLELEEINSGWKMSWYTDSTEEGSD